MDVLVIGAGVVGLATGAAFARRGANVVVAESGERIGGGISSRNSGVVHGGMYYPTGSLKARHCVAGREMLYRYCAARGVTFAKPGKLIVATDEAETQRLEALLALGQANGVAGFVAISGADARGMEPALSCVAALWSPETGTVDAPGLMLALRGEIEDAGGAVACGVRITALKRAREGWRAHMADGSEAVFDCVVNAAGLGSVALAAATEGLEARFVPRLHLAKGNYFSYRGPEVFRRLIYPVPVDGGLGAHVTPDVDGRMRFGPDVEWIDHEDYRVDPKRAPSFVKSVSRFFPGVVPELLEADTCGIRPKLSGPGEGFADFRVDGPEVHGLPGLVNLFGIDSPGLTSSLSLGEHVAGVLVAGQ